MASMCPVPADLTKCPSCQALCLGPTILPCGHLLCRKCVRNTLEDKDRHSQCPFCSRCIPRAQGQTVGDLVESLEKDLVIDDLVMGQLAGQTDLYCHVCPNKAATSVCLDCSEMYCAACSVAHRKHHVQQDLPQTLYNNHGSAIMQNGDQPDIIASTRPQDSIHYEHDPRPRQHTDKERLRQEGAMFQETASRLEEAVRVLEDRRAQLLEVKRRVEAKHQLLTAYLPRLHTPDDVMLPMLPRVTSVRQDCRPPPQASLTALTRHVNTLLDDVTASGKDDGTANGAVNADPMTSIPTRKFMFMPDADSDTHGAGPYVSSIVATDDGRLVMADCKNNTIKVARLGSLATTVRAVRLGTTPFRMALLHDGQVAVTARDEHIYFVDVSETPTVVSYVQTTRQYIGVGSVMETDTLVAGCGKEGDNAASIDVLTRAGIVVKSVIDSNTLTILSWPGHLYVQNQMVWISDHSANAVFKVRLHTDRVVSMYARPDLKGPLQVAVDRAGYCYIASYRGKCVLVVSPDCQWRRLLPGSESGDPLRAYPYGLCVTKRGVVVTWDRGICFGTDLASVVSGYELQ